MNTDKVLEAVRNTKSQKYFILMEDFEDRYRVVNPLGDIVTLSTTLFDDGITSVEPAQYSDFFTSEQINGYRSYLLRLVAEEQRQAQRAQQSTPTPTVKKVPEKAAPRSRRSRTSSSSSSFRTGLGASWSSSKLTFYRNRIEPLHNKQSFKVEVDGIGTFQMSKEDFLKNFNDVVMSSKYRSEGLYSYKELPQKALQFLKE